MNDFIGEGWQAILHHNNLDNFDALWELQADWFEPPNERRGGWSGVSRIQLETPAGETIGLFLKRQENHVCRSIKNPIRGVATFLREFKNIRRFQELKVPTLEPVFFGLHHVNGKQRAILVTRELAGYQPIVDRPQENPALHSIEARRSLFSTLAELMRRMHADRRQHGCLYLKHLFMKPLAEGGFDVRVIDLEKTRQLLSQKRAIFRDLYTLSRHAQGWSRSDCMRFFLIYRQEQHLSKEGKQLWRAIAAKIESKRSS
ncbi:MAG: lipopolysaccharide kinase InaA family protein [Candidatus Polarisedimenticolaceae bacterium]|nr:lipopolysaccharide kinase InaA family protein [Candidatus Polarisedimenticolaceae bacterium]